MTNLMPEMASLMREIIDLTEKGTKPYKTVSIIDALDRLVDADYIRPFIMAGAQYFAVQQRALDWYDRMQNGQREAFKIGLLKIGDFECHDEGTPNEQISSGDADVWVSFSYRNDRWELCAQMEERMSSTENILLAFAHAASVNDDLEAAMLKAKLLGVEIHWVAA